ncbi:MAG: glycosyltransferase family 4 protein [Muribaculaceae bacterium]|nr:glycosyltransferase family 4 protein [Muribaculaceae bacterium]
MKEPCIKPTSKNLIMVINEDRFFLSHRRQIGEEALRRGWKVTLLAGNTGLRGAIEDLGIEFVELPINPTGLNMREELKLLRFLYEYYKSHRDSIVFHVGVKNIIWGGIAARMAGVKGVVAGVSGLGSLYDSDRRYPPVSVINFLMRIGMRREGVRVIFQNQSDFCELLEAKVLFPAAASFTHGSGIDLQEVEYTPEPQDRQKIKVIFTGRMLRKKGITDLIEAAEILRPRWEEKLEVLICGDFTNNPESLNREYMLTHCDGKYIKWLGHRNDIIRLLQESAIMVFPSYYREGVPKSLIEASAVGRPIITTNSVGCAETVEEGVNGFKVGVHNPREIAQRVERLLLDNELRKKMGKASRRLAEERYDVWGVVETHLSLFEELRLNYYETTTKE